MIDNVSNKSTNNYNRSNKWILMYNSDAYLCSDTTINPLKAALCLIKWSQPCLRNREPPAKVHPAIKLLRCKNVQPESRKSYQNYRQSYESFLVILSKISHCFTSVLAVSLIWKTVRGSERVKSHFLIHTPCIYFWWNVVSLYCCALFWEEQTPR